MNVYWIRNDLRRIDNPALFYACESQRGVIAVVTLTPKQWEMHVESPAKMALWRDRLMELKDELSQLNIPLRVLQLGTFQDVPKALQHFVTSVGATKLFFNYEYPLNERSRDKAVCDELKAVGVECLGFHGELIVRPGLVLTGQGTPFKVFTPYSRAWRQHLLNHLTPALAIPAIQPLSSMPSDALPANLGWNALTNNEQVYNAHLWPVTTADIHQRLNRFIDEQEADYKALRDFPFKDKTSKLSPYLVLGAVSPRQCLAALMSHYASDAWLDSTWLNELIWREFYRHMLVAFPEQSKGHPFRPEVEEKIQWQFDETLFKAWCQGETGYPIVDAAMKQLLSTGWMHNRLRMVVASFLTKLLRIDWRIGADFFMSKLIDGDFASNQGGWQWSASVGADAAPYFRIFNPQLQSEKFDASGEFIAFWLPELRQLPAKQRHLPGAGQSLGRPAPIVDYKKARQSTLDAYQSHAK